MVWIFAAKGRGGRGGDVAHRRGVILRLGVLVYSHLGDKTLGRKTFGRKIRTFRRQHNILTCVQRTFLGDISGTFGRKMLDL